MKFALLSLLFISAANAATIPFRGGWNSTAPFSNDTVRSQNGSKTGNVLDTSLSANSDAAATDVTRIVSVTFVSTVTVTNDGGSTSEYVVTQTKTYAQQNGATGTTVDAADPIDTVTKDASADISNEVSTESSTQYANGSPVSTVKYTVSRTVTVTTFESGASPSSSAYAQFTGASNSSSSSSVNRSSSSSSVRLSSFSSSSSSSPSSSLGSSSSSSSYRSFSTSSNKSSSSVSSTTSRSSSVEVTSVSSSVSTPNSGSVEATSVTSSVSTPSSSSVEATSVTSSVSTPSSSSVEASSVIASASISSQASSETDNSSASRSLATASTVHTGTGTWYIPALGSCGTTSTEDDYVVAIGSELYNSDDYCGKKISASYGGKTVEVTVVDTCVSCGENDLDFSPAAFKELADESVGTIEVSWSWN